MTIITSLVVAASAVATAAGVGIASAPIASADNYPLIQQFGASEELVDGAGTIIQSWQVHDLRPSSDAIAWPVHGKLWEATVTVRAIRGFVTPIISDFNARARNGQDYQVLALVASPHGLNPSTLAQGGKSTGKLYFDVVGPPPDSVVYDAGGRDLLFWV